MLKCANPAVLINLQCPTTQVRDWMKLVLAAHSALCFPPTLPPRLIMQDWWAFSLRGCVVSSSSVSPSALTAFQPSWMHGVPTNGNITSNSASQASRSAARWVTVLSGLFSLCKQDENIYWPPSLFNVWHPGMFIFQFVTYFLRCCTWAYLSPQLIQATSIT